MSLGQLKKKIVKMFQNHLFLLTKGPDCRKLQATYKLFSFNGNSHCCIVLDSINEIEMDYVETSAQPTNPHFVPFTPLYYIHINQPKHIITFKVQIDHLKQYNIFT